MQDDTFQPYGFHLPGGALGAGDYNHEGSTARLSLLCTSQYQTKRSYVKQQQAHNEASYSGTYPYQSKYLLQQCRV